MGKRVHKEIESMPATKPAPTSMFAPTTLKGYLMGKIMSVYGLKHMFP
jgi:hypothetical protein